LEQKDIGYTICPADNATAGSLGRRRAGQLRFEFVAVSAGHIVYPYPFFAVIVIGYNILLWGLELDRI
jgi:hypothetical protein